MDYEINGIQITAEIPTDRTETLKAYASVFMGKKDKEEKGECNE